MAYEGIRAYLNWRTNKAIEKGYKAMCSPQDLIKYRLHVVNEELISYSTCESDTLTEIINTVRNVNNRTTTIGKEILRGT